VFHELLKPPSELPGAPAPGSSHSSALTINDITPGDLELFLRVILNPKYTNFDFVTAENWITVLKIAHNWKFNVLKEAAIQELQKIQLDTVLRVDMYQKNNVDTRYILPYYVDLCARNKTPTKQESKLLGHDTTIAVFQARELMLRSPAHVVSKGQDPPRSPLPDEVPRENIFKILKTVLEIDTGDTEDLPGPKGNTASNRTTTAASSSTGTVDNAQTVARNSGVRSRPNTLLGQPPAARNVPGRSG